MAGRRNPDKGQPFCIRLTVAEKSGLREKAAGLPLGTFIRNVILGDESRAQPARRQRPIRDGKPLGQILGLLGKSHLAGNLNQLAKAANQGTLPVNETTEADLRQACADVAEIRKLLMLALGMLSIEGDASVPLLADTFLRSAGAPAP